MKLVLGSIGLLLTLCLIVLFSTRTEGFTTSSVTARYIHLQQSQKGCLNLAEIRAYAYKGGPNLVTPQTNLTKSSNWHDPAFGRNEFGTDRNEDTIVHTACDEKDIPWIRIDLGTSQPIYKIHIINRKDCCINRMNGTVLSLLDDQQKPVYVSQPVKDKKGRATYAFPDWGAGGNEYQNMTDYYKTFTWYPPKADPNYEELDEDGIPASMKCQSRSTAFDLDGSGNLIYLDRQRVFCNPDEVMSGFHLVRESAAFPGKVRYNYTCCKVNSSLPPPSPFLQEGPATLSRLESEVDRIQKYIQRPVTLPTDIQTAPARVSSLASEFSQFKQEVPSRVASLSTEVSQLKKEVPTIASEFSQFKQEIPSKVASLEAEVQRIQQRIQQNQSASVPSAASASAPASLSSASPQRIDVVPQTTLSETGLQAIQQGQESGLTRDIQKIIRNELLALRSTTPL